MKYQLLYAETKKQVAVLLLYPWALLALFTFILVKIDFDKYLPLWLSVIIFIAVLISTMLFIFRRIMNIDAEVVFAEDALHITLVKTNFLYPHKNISIPIQNIHRLTEDENSQDDYRKYFSVTINHPHKSFLLMQPSKMSDAKESEFSKMIHNTIAHYNANPHLTPGLKIIDGSFYDAGWAKAITLLVYITSACLTIAALADILISWYQLLQFYIFAAIWLTAYHSGRKKSKQRL